MLAGAFLAGAALYGVSVSGRLRRSETYIGGERMAAVYVRGVARGDERDVEVTGVDFYDTVSGLRALRGFFRAAESGRLDPYAWGRAGLDRVTAVLGRAHSGSLPTYLAWSLLGVVWATAVLGILFQTALQKSWVAFTVALYIIMGWTALIALKTLIVAVAPGGLLLLLAGGITYTAGVAFYAWQALPYHHAIWHLFVLAGSALHFLAVLFYVIPIATVA